MWSFDYLNRPAAPFGVRTPRHLESLRDQAHFAIKVAVKRYSATDMVTSNSAQAQGAMLWPSAKMDALAN
jgi:hypothetical protein